MIFTRRQCLSIFLFLSTVSGLKASQIEYSDLAKDTYHNIISLKFIKAKEQIQLLKMQEPDNMVVVHLENYIQCLTLFIDEDQNAFEASKQIKKERLKLLESSDNNSPYYLYLQADIRMQWAMVRIKFEEYLGAFNDISKAHKLLKKNKELFPDFLPNDKNLGLLHALAGTIPDAYKWGVSLISGLKGSIKQGREEIKAVLEAAKHQDFLFEEETLVYYALILMHLENKPESAWEVLSANFRPENSPMHAMLLATIAMRSGRNDKAIEILENKPKSNQYNPFYFTDYLLGVAKLRRLDVDADVYLLKYVNHYKGRNFIKDAYQKLAWHALQKNDHMTYYRYMSHCMDKGKALTGDDISALQAANEKKIPNIHLINSRLLFDGAYFKKAEAELKKIDFKGLTDQKDQLEFFYRSGRVAHGLKQYSQAVFYYNRTIQLGKFSPYYFACNAALQGGIIYEKQKIYAKSKEYFELCLEIQPSEYRNGLHQQAKAGLDRISR
ncbi:MAG: hypothetical protein AAFO07_00125 [Bacteroidota bacterium]